MVMAGMVLEAPKRMADYFRVMAHVDRSAAVIDTVRHYLASWPKKRIAVVQRIDAGWAPFDAQQRPVPVNGVLDVRCIRDAVHAHCMALTEAGVPLTPELVELDVFFFTATELAEALEPA